MFVVYPICVPRNVAKYANRMVSKQASGGYSPSGLLDIANFEGGMVRGNKKHAPHGYWVGEASMLASRVSSHTPSLPLRKMERVWPVRCSGSLPCLDVTVTDSRVRQ